MAHAICTNRCYFGEHEFLVGEVLNVGEGSIPPHFKVASDEEVAGKRVHSAQKPRGKPTPSAADRAQAGEAVSFSELNGAAPVKEAQTYSDLL